MPLMFDAGKTTDSLCAWSLYVGTGMSLQRRYKDTFICAYSSWHPVWSKAILFTTSLQQEELIYSGPNRPAARACSLFMSNKFPPNYIYVAFLHLSARTYYLPNEWWFSCINCFFFLRLHIACKITSAHSCSEFSIGLLWPELLGLRSQALCRFHTRSWVNSVTRALWWRSAAWKARTRGLSKRGFWKAPENAGQPSLHRTVDWEDYVAKDTLTGTRCDSVAARPLTPEVRSRGN